MNMTANPPLTMDDDSASTAPATVSFLGLTYRPLDTDATVDVVVARAKSGAPFGYVVTPNVDHMVRLEATPELRQLYDAAWLTVCDSRILEVLARRDGHHLPAAPGADVVEALFRTHIQPDDTVTVIGGTETIIDTLREMFSLQNLHWHDAPMGLRKNPEAVAACAEFVAKHPAKYVFLCVGSPQQEMVAKAIHDRGDCVGVGLCCGASLDFLTGETARAPRWIREARLEWLHRMASEPGRLWKRYLIDGPKILAIWRRYRKAA